MCSGVIYGFYTRRFAVFSLSANLVLYSTLKWISAGLFSVQKKKVALVINSTVCIYPFCKCLVTFVNEYAKVTKRKKNLFCCIKICPVCSQKSSSHLHNIIQGGGAGLLKKMFAYHHLADSFFAGRKMRFYWPYC